MARFRYPLLFLAVLILPAAFALLFPDDAVSMIGYLSGYLAVFVFMTVVNYVTKETIYSKILRSAYLILNLFVSFLILRTLGLAILVVYMAYLLNPVSAALLLIVPWIAIQMLVLYFFVRYERRSE